MKRAGALWSPSVAGDVSAGLVANECRGAVCVQRPIWKGLPLWCDGDYSDDGEYGVRRFDGNEKGRTKERSCPKKRTPNGPHSGEGKSDEPKVLD
jgi:hypothetical protein